MVSNDDGVTSPGIVALADAASSLGSVMIIGPDGEQSAAGMSLTFHRPLRVTKVHVGRTVAYAVSGSPADSTMIGLHSILPRKPDAVISGINLGENVTIQDVFASGTVAAALSAALMGIPAIAFSMEIPPNKMVVHGKKDPSFSIPARIAAEILREVLEEGMPKGADLLNVNFPWGTGSGHAHQDDVAGGQEVEGLGARAQGPPRQTILLARGDQATELPEGLGRVRGAQAEGHLHLSPLLRFYAEEFSRVQEL